MKVDSFERLLWSIAFPGFGQLLNGQVFKGVLFVGLEFLINVQSHLNAAIITSFHGDLSASVQQTNYQWLMFYPCVYMFAVWDSYTFAGGGQGRFGYLPFVFSAYTGTLGVIYSTDWWGPVWLPIVGLMVGAVIGWMLRRLLVTLTKNA
ncbi:hypothetical protein [Tumebacillus permanentifrigoris]|uniref:Uncharacterized protein n=1 Tax=Tumebacillus permanentifrigoris TaxID=378543 RepID=A0A316D752_9BACL|nr:hypothetical protein [Tumebacillus permanentifrigoris]PWK11286.1 hypothetical protein C7459_11180 [Tumebacillus permanentifrigoris]